MQCMTGKYCIPTTATATFGFCLIGLFFRRSLQVPQRSSRNEPSGIAGARFHSLQAACLSCHRPNSVKPTGHAARKLIVANLQKNYYYHQYHYHYHFWLLFNQPILRRSFQVKPSPPKKNLWGLQGNLQRKCCSKQNGISQSAYLHQLHQQQSNPNAAIQ